LAAACAADVSNKKLVPAMPSLRYWILSIFIASALYAHFRGRVCFGLVRALTDFTALLAPFNALMYLFSRVKPTAYLNPKDFPELDVLQQHWQEIREEALQLAGGGQIKAASGYNDIGFNSFFRTGWKRFYLKWYGDNLPSAQQMCPRTVQLLAGIPTIKAAMFASLPPGSRLVRHRDPYAGSLRYHLGLLTPNSPQCHIVVDGQTYHWRDGEAVMFDETYIHHAENTTEHQRIILFCDVERPLHGRLLTWFNRGFAAIVMKASATQNVEGEPVGALNKFFHYAYQVRLVGKKLKQQSKAAYYVVKWALIGGLLYWIFA
jgi:beta-hydroxylase